MHLQIYPWTHSPSFNKCVLGALNVPRLVLVAAGHRDATGKGHDNPELSLSRTDRELCPCPNRTHLPMPALPGEVRALYTPHPDFSGPTWSVSQRPISELEALCVLVTGRCAQGPWLGGDLFLVFIPLSLSCLLICKDGCCSFSLCRAAVKVQLGAP